MPDHPADVSVWLQPWKRLKGHSREPARQALRTAHRGLTDVTTQCTPRVPAGVRGMPDYLVGGAALALATGLHLAWKWQLPLRVTAALGGLIYGRP